MGGMVLLDYRKSCPIQWDGDAETGQGRGSTSRSPCAHMLLQVRLWLSYKSKHVDQAALSGEVHNKKKVDTALAD